MSRAILTIAAAMFGIPLVIMVAIAVTGSEIPSFMLFVGGWSMALGVLAGGIGAVIAAYGG